MSMPFVDLKAQYIRLKQDIDRRVLAVMDHGRFIMGPEVEELEDALCAYVGCKHAITTSSGTDALLATLMAWKIGSGDVVFLPAFTFPASAEVVALNGATPVFVDVDINTCNMAPNALDQAINLVKTTTDYRPAAIIAVDLYGMPANYPALRKIANKEGLYLLADAAQSVGGKQNSQNVGVLADATATSFFPAKPLGCYGDGGAVFTDDDELATLLRSLRAHGRGDDKYDIKHIGLNARLDTIQAAVLLSKLTIFDSEIENREAVSQIYDDCLGSVVTTPGRQSGSDSAWAQYTIQIDDRDGLATALKKLGVPTAVYYPRAMHHQPAYGSFGRVGQSLAVSEKLANTVLSIPIHPYLGDDGAMHIADSIRSVLSV